MNKLQKYLEYQKFKKNPEMAMLEFINKIKQEIDQKISEALKENLKTNFITRSIELAEEVVHKFVEQEVQDYRDEIQNQKDIVLNDFEISKDDILKKLEDIVTKISSNLSEHKSEILVKIDKNSTDMLTECKQRCDKMLLNIEKMRGPQGDPGESIKGDKGDNPTGEELFFLIRQVFEEIKDTLKGERGKIGLTGKTIKGGGGMGKVIHQVFNLTASTTTVTLDYEIAGNGTAIFAARYQGQVQDLGVHYSVSGKIITLLFTPEDGTKWSISYVRG